MEEPVRPEVVVTDPRRPVGPEDSLSSAPPWQPGRRTALVVVLVLLVGAGLLVRSQLKNDPGPVHVAWADSVFRFRAGGTAGAREVVLGLQLSNSGPEPLTVTAAGLQATGLQLLGGGTEVPAGAQRTVFIAQDVHCDRGRADLIFPASPRAVVTVRRAGHREQQVTTALPGDVLEQATAGQGACPPDNAADASVVGALAASAVRPGAGGVLIDVTVSSHADRARRVLGVGGPASFSYELRQRGLSVVAPVDLPGGSTQVFELAVRPGAGTCQPGADVDVTLDLFTDGGSGSIIQAARLALPATGLSALVAVACR